MNGLDLVGHKPMHVYLDASPVTLVGRNKIDLLMTKGVALISSRVL